MPKFIFETSTIGYSYFEDEGEKKWIEVPRKNLKNENVTIFVKALSTKNCFLVKRLEKVQDIIDNQKSWIDNGGVRGATVTASCP